MMIVISGPSASGKTTLQKMLEESGMMAAVSTTTREPRSYEEDGVDYHFVTPEEFEASDDMVERVVFDGVGYGLTGAEISRCIADDGICTAVVEPHGALLLRDYCATNEIKHMSVFLDGELEVLVKRFLKRELHSMDLEADPIVIAPRFVSRIIKLISEEHPQGRHSGAWDMYFSSFDYFNASTVQEAVEIKAEVFRKAA